MDNNEIDKKKKKLMIKLLVEEEKYDEIYELFGQKDYLDYADEDYMEEDIEKLIDQRRFEEIYVKYGSDYYDEYIGEMNRKENLDETGKAYIDKEILAHLAIKKLKLYGGHFLLNTAFLLTVALPVMRDVPVMINTSRCADELEIYDKQVKDYASYINSLNLNDLQIIMKTMDDILNRMKGYNEDVADYAYGIFRLNLLHENGVGVCRHIADDMAARLNAINPEYNARCINVYLNNTPLNREANIIMKHVDDEGNVFYYKHDYDNNSNSNNNSSNNNYIDGGSTTISVEEIQKNLVGNHMVVLVDIKEEDLTLVVDPTNPSLGVFKDGQIYMFSTKDGEGYANPFLSQFIFGVDAVLDYEKVKNKSKFSNYEFNLLREKWGIDAENDALDYVRTLENNKKMR